MGGGGALSPTAGGAKLEKAGSFIAKPQVCFS